MKKATETPSTSTNCFNVYTARSNMTDGQSFFLIVYAMAINGILNLVMNFLVLLSLKMSGQLKTYSMRLIAYISFSDICISITTPSMIYILLTRYKDSIHCNLEITAQFLNMFFGHTSANIVALIAYDRYARVRYLNEYKFKMSEKKTKCLVMLAVLLAVFNAALYTFGSLFGFYRIIWYIVLVIDSFAVIFMGLFYILATLIIKKRRNEAENGEVMKSVDKSMTSLTKKFMMSVVLFYGVYIIFNFANIVAHEESTGNTRGWLEFLLYFGLLIGVTNSVSNALIFISVNKKTQRCLKRTFLRQSNQMTEVDTVLDA